MKDWNLKKLLIYLIGAFMARVVIVSMNPIAIAYFAALYLEKTGRLVIIGSILAGMVTVLPFVEASKYLIVMIVVSIITSLLEYNNKRLTIITISSLAAVITSMMSITNGLLTNNIGYSILLAIAEGLVVFAMAIIFRRGLDPLIHGIKGQALDNEQIVSIAILLGIFIYGIPNIESMGISFTLTAILFSVLFIGYKYGAGYGAVAGTACGIILALKGGHMNQVGIMCMLGVLSGTFREMGRLVTLFLYTAGVIVLGELYQNLQINAQEIGALVSSAVLFLLLPKTIIYRLNLESNENNDEIFVKQSVQNIAKGKLRDFAESFQNLSNTFSSISEKKIALSKQDKSQIFDEVSENLCKECSNCNVCWKSCFYETYQGAHYILEHVEKNGTILLEEVPKEFASRCIKLENYLMETRRVLELAKLNLIWYNRMAESREAIAGQLCEVANIIDDFSVNLYKTVDTPENKKKQIVYLLRANHIITKRIAVFEKRNDKQEIYITARTEKGRCITTKEAASLVSEIFGKRMRPSDGCKKVITKDFETFIFIEDADFLVYTGMARMTKEGGRISGDNYSFIYPEPGTVVMTLSDGMGTGEAACEESESIVELLEQFLEAGFKKESAIKLINSILVLRSEEQTFSTIDLSVINLYTGICDLIKIGASTTFIKRSDWVEKIASNTLPVGFINQVDYEVISKKLYDGDFIIMVTDGVIDCIPGDEKEKLLEEFIMDINMNNPQEIANAVLNQALELNQWVPRDDMTVLVAGFWKK